LIKRRYIFLAAVLILFILIWQLPEILKAIPSRYVAAYLPEPVQSLAAREHVEILPTAVVSSDANALLEFDILVQERQTNEEVETPQLKAGSPDQAFQTPVPANLISGTEMTKETDPLEPTEEPLNTPLPTPTPTISPTPLPASMRLMDFRHHFQTWNNCGPATLAMALSHFDLYVTQDETASVLKPSPEDRNVSPHEMVRYVNEFSDFNSLERSNGTLDTILELLANGYPVIVELGLDPPGEYRWMGWYGHYLLIVAFDLDVKQFWVYDSWFGTSVVPDENADPNGRIIEFADLDRYWQQFNRSYIVLFEPEDLANVEQIIGPDIGDEIMWQNSLKSAQGALADQPDNEYLWFNLGTSYTALGEYDKAAAAFDRGRAIGLPWRMLWYQFGPYEAYYQVGRYEDVLTLADVTLMNRPYFEESYYYKGLALEAMGDIEEAKSNYEKAMRFNPEYDLARVAFEKLGG